MVFPVACDISDLAVPYLFQNEVTTIHIINVVLQNGYYCRIVSETAFC